MHRLTEHQLVTICPPPDLARVTAFQCYVVAIDGQVISLHPARAIDVAWMPNKLDEVMLTFQQRGQMIALSGTLRYQAVSEDLRFRVTDKVQLPPRRSSPLQLCAPVTLTPVDANGMPTGPEVALQTQELAPDGVLLEPARDELPAGLLDVAVTLPKDAEPVRARGVVRAGWDDAGARVDFVAIAAVDRRRIRAFVADHLRERFKMLRAYQELNDEPF